MFSFTQNALLCGCQMTKRPSGHWRALTKHDVECVAMEATSRYLPLAHAMLHDAGLAVCVINPFRSRQFANSTGRLAKTDTIDAETSRCSLSR